MRRLLGYVVKLPDGTRSGLTPKPAPLADVVKWVGTSDEWNGAVVPVYRKPKPAPVVLGCGKTISVGAPHFGRTTCGASDSPRGFTLCTGCERKAKRPVAAEGRYAVLHEGWPRPEIVQFVDLDAEHEEPPVRHVGSASEARHTVALNPEYRSVVRVLADGEHEAAVEAARRTAFDEVTAFAEMMRKEYTDHPGEKVWTTAVLSAFDAFTRFVGERRKVAAEEAAKGQAK